MSFIPTNLESGIVATRLPLNTFVYPISSVSSSSAGAAEAPPTTTIAVSAEKLIPSASLSTTSCSVLAAITPAVQTKTSATMPAIASSSLFLETVASVGVIGQSDITQSPQQRQKKSATNTANPAGGAAAQDSLLSPRTTEWKSKLKQQMEMEFEQKVRMALNTPPMERLNRARELAYKRQQESLQQCHRQHTNEEAAFKAGRGAHHPPVVYRLPPYIHGPHAFAAANIKLTQKERDLLHGKKSVAGGVVKTQNLASLLALATSASSSKGKKGGSRSHQQLQDEKSASGEPGSASSSLSNPSNNKYEYWLNSPMLPQDVMMRNFRAGLPPGNWANSLCKHAAGSESDANSSGSSSEYVPPWKMFESLLIMSSGGSGGGVAGSSDSNPAVTTRELQAMQEKLGESLDAADHLDALNNEEREVLFDTFTRTGFAHALKTGRFPDGGRLVPVDNSSYRDKFGIVRDHNGPFWPKCEGPLCVSQVNYRARAPEAPEIQRLIAISGGRTSNSQTSAGDECKFDDSFNMEAQKTGVSAARPGNTASTNENPANSLQNAEHTVEKQTTRYSGHWCGCKIVYDSETSPRSQSTTKTNPKNLCPSLRFESRFESGNLRQVRRIGQFTYELALKTDLYTKRHTQWFYFRVSQMRKDITYKFIIINFLKSSSLYSHGMKPLVYSTKNFERNNIGWHRSGHSIKYCRNSTNLSSNIISKDFAYYQLEWQMEFLNEDDEVYIAHCYPYTYSDLKSDIVRFKECQADVPHYNSYIKVNVLCETKLGNSCFVLTITDPNISNKLKLGVVISARVHPGETNSSWMMRGLIDFLISSDEAAQDLRKRLVFKIIPMINPDGVIIGNYRCSLFGRDLNRNYRNPREESFPVVWNIKNLVQKLQSSCPILLYCDLHGHSRKNNVFMYGCDSIYRSASDSTSSSSNLEASSFPSSFNPSHSQQQNSTKLSAKNMKDFFSDRLFPWCMSQLAPNHFCFDSCRFHIEKNKESTGRVVMWRQFGIQNSYTLEATFSGTTINKLNKHFNTNDLEEIGRQLANCLRIYQDTIKDEKQYNCVIYSLAKNVLKQTLQKKHNFSQNTLNCLSAYMKRQQATHRDKSMATADDKETTPHQQLHETDTQPRQPMINTEQDSDVYNLISRIDEMSFENISYLLTTIGQEAAAPPGNPADQPQRKESSKDSSSSDSNSEPEPEIKPKDAASECSGKSKKKKRHAATKKAGDGGGKDTAKKQITSIEEIIKSQQKTQELPNLTSNYNDKHSLNNPSKKSLEVNPARYLQGNATSSSPEGGKLHLGANHHHPKFISKYEGRFNNGIPCFVAERIQERMYKRDGSMLNLKNNPSQLFGAENLLNSYLEEYRLATSSKDSDNNYANLKNHIDKLLVGSPPQSQNSKEISLAKHRLSFQETPDFPCHPETSPFVIKEEISSRNSREATRGKERPTPQFFPPSRVFKSSTRNPHNPYQRHNSEGQLTTPIPMRPLPNAGSIQPQKPPSKAACSSSSAAAAMTSFGGGGGDDAAPKYKRDVTFYIDEHGRNSLIVMPDQQQKQQQHQQKSDASKRGGGTAGKSIVPSIERRALRRAFTSVDGW